MFFMLFINVFSQLDTESYNLKSSIISETHQEFDDELFQEILNLQKKINVIVSEKSLENKLADLKSAYLNDLIQHCPNIPDSDFTQIPMRSLHLWVLNFEKQAEFYKNQLIKIYSELSQ